MRWRRFFLVLVGFLLSISFSGISCTQQPTIVPKPESFERNVSLPKSILEESATLPPKTAKIVASVGAEGLFNPPRGDVRLVVISDLNGAYGSTDYEPEVGKALDLLPFWKPDLVVCSGDMIAGQNPSLSEKEIRDMWAAFDASVAAPLRQAKLPFGFTIGNHDASSALGVKGQHLFSTGTRFGD